ncbi:DUF7544 domain-containing protein [Halopelagius longus]|uniref:Uncharacterized protein n=1 Tax=Halopelagius longus TaxID=1236180 RepID=A0A1H1BPX3_9EURY|nr:hypothetical protein [Halopelagius longus]RDI70872.1 hypothetical protein DWB78_03540 [Halopelagius longus]SDQ53991.1 hypothetical protein SAMN05216278_1895 [Halopelagius longus]
MSWNAVDALSDARAATQSLLLPFDLGTWAKLSLVVFFVGTGTNASMTANGSGSSGGNVASTSDFDLGTFSPDELVASVDLASLLVGLLAVFVLLYLLYSFLGSVFEFVFVDNVTSPRVRLRGPFRRHLLDGIRLFAFESVLGAAALSLIAVPVAMVLLGAVPLGSGALFALIPLVLLGVLAAVVVAFVLGLTRDFVVPTMLVEDRGVLSGWRRVLPTMRAEWKEFALYVVLRIALNVLSGALLSVALGLVALVVAVPFVLVGGVIWTAFSPFAVALTPGTVLLGALVGLYVACLTVAGLFVTVPVAAYFRYYSLYFLARADSELALVDRPDAPERPAEGGPDAGPTDADADRL